MSMGKAITGNTKESGPDKWDIESAARTLIEAEELKKDCALYDLALAEVKRQQDAASNVLSGKQIEAKVTKKLKSIFKKN